MPVKNAPKSLLFRLSHPEAANDSYLFGTIHLRDIRAFKHFEKAKNALEKCTRFAAEFNLADADSAAIENASQLPDGKTIADFLTPSIMKKLEKRLEKTVKVPISALKRSHPLSISSLLSGANLGEQMPLTLDQELSNAAENVNLEMTGVETFAEQLAVFTALPLDESFKNLAWLVKNFRRSNAQTEKMVDLYALGDVQKLYKSARRSARGLREVLIFERNARMTARIAHFSLEKSTFSAIGAGHLGGAKGVLRGLKKLGFRVTAI
jgi:uncharacterized protein